MLKYEKVPERSKNRLKLKDIGYQGLIACLSDVPSSMLLFRCLSEQVLGAGTTSPGHPSPTRAVGSSLVASHKAQLVLGLGAFDDFWGQKEVSHHRTVSPCLQTPPTTRTWWPWFTCPTGLS